MTTRFDPDFNEEIRRVVKNFNQKRARAYKRGFSYLPDRAYVSKIKQNFNTKSEVNKYLKDLEKFNTMGDSAFDIVETAMGGRISKYNLMFIKDNLKDTKAFFDRQIEEAKELFYEDQYSIARKDYLFNLQTKRRYLEQDIMNLDQSGLRTFDKYVKQALNNNRNMLTSYKGFLSVIDTAMREVGYDEKTISAFYEKLGDLTPAQFIKMYRSNNLINRVYNLIESPVHGATKMNLSGDDAKLLLDKLIKDFDFMKEEALADRKQPVTPAEAMEQEIELETEEPISSPDRTPEGKLKKSRLSPEEIEQLKMAGWSDLIDENA